GIPQCPQWMLYFSPGSFRLGILWGRRRFGLRKTSAGGDMALFRRVVILSHRYLGIALSLIFVVWFASGITMMWWGGMPRLTADERLERLPALDPRTVRLTPSRRADKVWR